MESEPRYFKKVQREISKKALEDPKYHIAADYLRELVYYSHVIRLHGNPGPLSMNRISTRIQENPERRANYSPDRIKNFPALLSQVKRVKSWAEKRMLTSKPQDYGEEGALTINNLYLGSSEIMKLLNELYKKGNI